MDEPDSPLVDECAPSPNHGPRIGCARADAIVLHYTGMPQDGRAQAWREDPAGQALALLRDPAAQVSSHYLVREDGRILQLVPEARRAWHAGAAFWAGETDINSRSIGVEIVNTGHDGGLPAFPDAQIEAVIALCRDMAARLAIRPERILGHSDVAPGRKLDPGERFPWAALARAGVGLWTQPASLDAPGPTYGPRAEGQPVRALQELLAVFGYGVELTGVYDQRTQDVIAAFQRHWRQVRVDGVADASTTITLRNLMRARDGGAPDLREGTVS